MAQNSVFDVAFDNIHRAKGLRNHHTGDPFSRKRADPTEAGEAGEIGVATVEFGLMFQSKRGELGMGCQIAAGSEMR